ncbi:chemokine-like factor [Cricetulus griseus]|uniref:Chemokine-like factor n=1 Tax=Cricetulus griseus TaxID=10029 RepID=A0A8C2MKY4_CRIGR|nr:chemokine-like factor [Cricetulus griseus]
MNPAYTGRESRRDSRFDTSYPPSRASLQSQFEYPHSRSESLASISSAASRKGPPPSATPSIRSIQSVFKEQIARKVLPKKFTQSQKAPLPPHLQGHASIKGRPEGLAKVPERVRDSFKNFFFSPTGMLKVLRMCVIAASVFCFIIGGAHKVFIAITIEETCIVLFFIVIYLLTLQHWLTCVNWPLLDFINSFISTVFLGGVALIIFQEKERKRLHYVGGILCLFATVLCIIDGFLVIKNMRKDKKKGPGYIN